ncbi:hypothetical protein MUK42_34234 [Musa troglodytarum]|uniref:Uncharacterized protein n=1 Tax=Musa troglodytarum TaxID=320322 RepID=A0A9E7IBR8_9LILI|nr:hypothetical protein MUK42_34234 [Musa troglodytarum]
MGRVGRTVSRAAESRRHSFCGNVMRGVAHTSSLWATTLPLELFLG